MAKLVMRRIYATWSWVILAAVVVQFFYVGTQVATWSTFIPYMKEYTTVSERTAGLYLTGNLVALFFSEQLDDIARAKAFCGECPVKEACFEAALVRREPYGVWGGRLFFKGKVLAVKRPRGRPPKNPRPEVVAASDQETLIA